MSDKEIIQLCMQEATRNKGFQQMVSAYSKKIYWHVRRMVTSHDDANDVVQNCFIKAWKGLPEFKGNSQLYTWLYRIATNEAITFLKDKYRRTSIAIEGAADDYLLQLQEDVWFDGNEMQRQLQTAIDTLPDKQKQVFVMRYFDELKYEEMEQILGTSTGALKASFHHAVKKIELFLKEGLNRA